MWRNRPSTSCIRTVSYTHLDVYKRQVFKGVNRHEFSSVSGRHVSEEELRKDLRTMKQNNINAIRTCHYPDASKIYELCDEYGIYMIDETNLE